MLPKASTHFCRSGVPIGVDDEDVRGGRKP
jgi:hypothetical protein